MTSFVTVSRVAGAVAVAFGVLTLISGGTTLLDDIDMGAVVPFVLWFNTIAGALYILAGIGLWFRKRWALPLSFLIFAATLLVFFGFGLHVARGGEYEMRTVFAMSFRTLVWGGFTLIARHVTEKTLGPLHQ
jgi:hypothetical protein